MRKAFVAVVVASLIALAGCALFKPPTDDTLLYEETFSDPSTTAWTQNETEARTKSIEDGRYHWVIKTNTSTWSWNNGEGPFDDFQLDLDVSHIAGPDNESAAGAVFRVVDGDNFYLFRVSPLGTYYFAKSEGGSWTKIVDWASSDAINKGVATNHITIIADGAYITVYVNEEKLVDETDQTFASGYVGVIGTSYTDTEDVHVAFDNLVVHSLE